MTFLMGEMLGLLALAVVVGLVAGVVIGRSGRSKRTQTAAADVDRDYPTVDEWYSSTPPAGSEERWASDLVALEAELATVRNALELATAERHELLAKVEESTAGMKCQWEELVAARRHIVDVEFDVVDAETRLDAGRTEIDRVTGQMRSLELVVAAQDVELGDRDATLSRLRSELFTRETELERLRSQGAAVGRQLVAFEREVPTLRQRAARADVDGSRASAHRREIDSKRRRLADLEHQLDDVVVLRNELVFVRQRESDLKTVVADSSITVQVLRKRVDELEEEVGLLKTELDDLQGPLEMPEIEESPPVFVERADDADLTRIDGIGTVLERMLVNRGITRLQDIAALGDDGIDQLQAQLTGFPGRIRRDRWVAQARELLARDGGERFDQGSGGDDVGEQPPSL